MKQGTKNAWLIVWGVFIPLFTLYNFTGLVATYSLLIQEIESERHYITYKAPRLPERFTLEGRASWYDYVLASGWSSKGHFVCATRDFERYSMVRVTNSDTDKSIECKVTDWVENPDVIIDLSSTAFDALLPLHRGIIQRVKVEQL